MCSHPLSCLRAPKRKSVERAIFNIAKFLKAWNTLLKILFHEEVWLKLINWFVGKCLKLLFKSKPQCGAAAAAVEYISFVCLKNKSGAVLQIIYAILSIDKATLPSNKQSLSHTWIGLCRRRGFNLSPQKAIIAAPPYPWLGTSVSFFSIIVHPVSPPPLSPPYPPVPSPVPSWEHS